MDVFQKFDAGAGAVLTVTALSTDYSTAVVVGDTYRVQADNGTILVGVASCNTASNALLSVPAGTWDYFTVPTYSAATSNQLHYTSYTGAGVTGRISRFGRFAKMHTD